MYNPQKASAPFPVPLGNPPDCKLGRRAIHVLIDFSLGTTYSLDLSQIQSQGQMDSVQTLYIDNSQNTGTITVQMGLTLQSVTLPAGSQAYLPVLQGNPPVMQFSVASGTPVVNVQLMNFFVPPCVWGPTGTTVTDATLAGILVNNQVPTVTNPNNPALVDHSGTIAAGGTAQLVLNTNTSRKKLIVFNPSTATEILQLMFGASTAGKIDLTAGGSYVAESDSVENNSVYLVAATTGHAYTVYEG